MHQETELQAARTWKQQAELLKTTLIAEHAKKQELEAEIKRLDAHQCKPVCVFHEADTIERSGQGIRRG